MSDADDALRGAEQAQQVAHEVKEVVRQAQQGQVPAKQVGKLEQALAQIPVVQQATQQLGQAGQAVRQVREVAERVMGGIEALSGTMQSIVSGLKPMEKVRFTFESSADPGGTWRVVALHSREGLSELYTCTLDLANEHLGADVEELLGSSAEVLICREASARRLCGVIHRVEHTGTKAGHLLARVHIVPALWILSQRRDSFIFQEKTVPKILEEVLSEGLQPFGRSYRLELRREFQPREYCVQYRETDLDFLLRLMEEEGLFFYFDHSGDKEELVVAEENEQCPSCEAVNGNPITVKGPEAATAEDESLRHFDFSQQLHTTSVMIRDFDWTQPGVDLTKKAPVQDSQKRDREHYEYPAPLLGPYDEGTKKYKHEQKQEELRRQAFQVEGKRGRGEGVVTGFEPGRMFELTGHGNPAFDQWYLLTRVEHVGHAPEELTSDTHEQDKEGLARERYRNTFECIPLDVAFRPERRRSRARMAGLQTAKVVGPENQEIFTDKHGRIKVKFHWDRDERKDDKCSCFLRVSQAWAGPRWGFFFLPRIGMEVLVDFLEGDPDRPLVVGCVYNGENEPPYEMPQNQTRSTIRTSSSLSKERVGFNELSFEDAANGEEIFLHAQKDFNEVVLHNHSTQVKANQTNAVDINQTETVGGNQAMSVKGNRTKTVDKDETTTVKQNRTETVEQNEKITIQGTRTEEVTQQETLKLNAGRDTTVNTLEKLLVTGNREEKVDGNDTLDVTGDKADHITQNWVMTGDQQVQAVQGECSITLKDSITIEGTSKKVAVHNSSGQVVFDGNKIEVTAVDELSLVCGAASIKLKKNGTVEINGAKEVNLGAQQSTLKLEAAGGTLSAPKLTSSAIGIHEITGALIKIN